VERVVAGLRGPVEAAVRGGIGKAAEELVKCSADMDLVVLGSRGYGPARTMLLGSVSSQVVSEARCP
jgi:nucleotide-binding universal stress UspA family protein